MAILPSYHFKRIEHCNMCGSESAKHKVLGKRLNQSQGLRPRKKSGICTTIMKCLHCGLIFSNPQPNPFDIQDHYGKLPEDYWKDSYFKDDDSYFKGEIETLKQLIDFKPGMKSLDIGAGIGKAMKALSNAGFDAYGFEPSVQFHERALTKMAIRDEKLKLGSMEQLNYPNEEFDFISFGAVLEHVYDPSASLIKAMHWLKPGGIMHAEVPSSNWLINKLGNFYYKLTGTDYVSNISPMHEPYHLYEFGLKSFQKHAQTHGYDIALYNYYVGDTYLPKLLDVFLRPYMRYTNSGMQLCVWLRKK